MNTTPPLTGAHLRTYNTIFQHPISHNLGWQDVHALFREIGELHEETNGNLKAMRNGETLVLHPASTKDVSEASEIMALRHFLERSGAAAPAVAEDAHWLLVIDHREAKIFRSVLSGTVPQHVLPHDPEDFFRHPRNSKDFSRGQEKPDPNSYFEPVATALLSDGPILVMGSGTGMSNEMDQFIAWAKHRHPELAKRISGSLIVDEHHLTEAQLLAKAREFYVKAGLAEVQKG